MPLWTWAYVLVPEAYRQRFRGSRKVDKQTFVEGGAKYHRLSTTFITRDHKLRLSPTKDLLWDTKCELAFQSVKALLSSSPVLLEKSRLSWRLMQVGLVLVLYCCRRILRVSIIPFVISPRCSLQPKVGIAPLKKRL